MLPTEVAPVAGALASPMGTLINGCVIFIASEILRSKGVSKAMYSSMGIG